MSIRRANKLDCEQLSRLVLSLSYFYLQDGKESLPQWLEQNLAVNSFLSRLSNSEYLNYVYEENERIIGYISLKLPNHLFHLFVAEGYQRQGIAKQLWQYILKESQEKSYIVRSSLYAIPVYKQLGFKRQGWVTSKDGVSFQLMTWQEDISFS